MRVYISGKITGTDDYHARFANAHTKLVASGHMVIDPVEVCSSLPRDMKHAEYMSVCIPLLMLADAVYMLKGWEQSLGARVEYRRAKERGKEIIYE